MTDEQVIGYNVDAIAMIRSPDPAHGDIVHPSRQRRFPRLACKVLRTVTAANAIGGILSLALNPYRTRPNWGDQAVLSLHNVWMATGYASLAILVGWVAVYLGLRLRRDLSVRIGFVVSIVHAAVWLLLPRLS